MCLLIHIEIHSSEVKFTLSLCKLNLKISGTQRISVFVIKFIMTTEGEVDLVVTGASKPDEEIIEYVHQTRVFYSEFSIKENGRVCNYSGILSKPVLC